MPVQTVAPLLKYAVVSTPDPIQASPEEGDSSYASLTIVVSNPFVSQEIDVTSIYFMFPIGAAARDFTSHKTGFTLLSPEGWKFTEVKGSPGMFQVKPAKKGTKIGNSGLSFTLSDVPVNKTPGVFNLTIYESAVLAQAPGLAVMPWLMAAEENGKELARLAEAGMLLMGGGETSGEKTVPLAKFPPGFTVSQLEANPTSVEPGGSATLSWHGSPGANYTLEDGSPNPIAVGNNGPYTAKDLQENTTFTLNVKTTVSQSTVKVQRQVTVDVQRTSIVNFSPSAFRVEVGASIDLQWGTNNATSCELQSSHALETLSGLSPNTSEFAVSPVVQTTYTLIAKGPYTSDSQQITISPSYLKTGWNQVTAAAPWSGLQTPVSLEFQGKLWLLAPTLGKVYSSSDGSNWTLESSSAPWTSLYWPTATVFDGGDGEKIWLLGGSSRLFSDFRNDVWSSADGKTWHKSTAPWPARAFFGSVAFDGKLWIFGGIGKEVFGDVWSSSDGTTWNEVSLRTGFSPRCAFGAAVFNGRIWILGGTSRYWGMQEVWSSSDGENWEKSSSPPWSARCRSGVAVAAGRLWLVGGQKSFLGPPVFQDLWSLDASGTWKAQGAGVPLVSDHGTNPAFTVTSYWNSVWAMGGITSPGGNTKAVEVYIPELAEQPLR